jgi:hypothetical protein
VEIIGRIAFTYAMTVLEPYPRFFPVSNAPETAFVTNKKPRALFRGTGANRYGTGARIPMGPRPATRASAARLKGQLVFVPYKLVQDARRPDLTRHVGAPQFAADLRHDLNMPCFGHRLIKPVDGISALDYIAPQERRRPVKPFLSANFAS